MLYRIRTRHLNVVTRVVPLAGAWIEIFIMFLEELLNGFNRHSAFSFYLIKYFAFRLLRSRPMFCCFDIRKNENSNKKHPFGCFYRTRYRKPSDLAVHALYIIHCARKPIFAVKVSPTGCVQKIAPNIFLHLNLLQTESNAAIRKSKWPPKPCILNGLRSHRVYSRSLGFIHSKVFLLS